MASRDYYKTLGVEKGASGADIKKAYRRLAKEYHPDRNPETSAEDKFREVAEAYEILSDDQKRATYDQFGAGAFDGSAGPGGAGFGFSGFGSSFADVFDDLFGDFRGRQRPGAGVRNRGGDVRYNLEVSLEDAFNGRTTQIRVPATVTCDTCKGTGSADASSAATCGTCNGVGRVRAQQGFFTIERACPTCHGAGQVIKNPCSACSGSGRVRKEKMLSVKIPAGVEDGTRIRLSGEGEAGVRGGPPGDLYIFLSLAAHRMFQRDGRNLYCRVHIPMVTATLGGTIDVPALDSGGAKVTVPAGTQSGRQFRLKGKGMPALRGKGHGDLYVQTVVETPVHLTKKQQKLLKEFADGGEGRTNNPESESFLDKLKEFWDDLKD